MGNRNIDLDGRTERGKEDNDEGDSRSEEGRNKGGEVEKANNAV